MTIAALSSIRFRGLIAPEEVPTGDHRIFARNSLTHRRLPRPVMFVRELTQRHLGAVAVARLEAIEYAPGRGWIGSGTFLDPAIVPEVTEAIYLVQQGVSSPSVDLQPNVTAEVVVHPIMAQERALRVLTGRIMGFTFVPYPAFEEVEITVESVRDESILASAGIAFAINSGAWRGFPIAERETEFNYDAVVPRLVEWSGGQSSKFKRAFLYQVAAGDVTSTESYLLPVADVLDGTLTLIPRAVFSAAAFLSGAHGGLPQVPEPDLEKLRNVVTDIYAVLQEKFGDPRLRPPWTRGGRQDARGAHDMEPTVTSTTGNSITITWSGLPATYQDDNGDGECGNIDTPDAGDLNTAARECAARRGWAMEGGRYPIRSEEMHGASDLAKAIKAVGRGGGSHDEIRQHIMKRARSLGLSDEIPENWTSSGGKGEAGVDPTTFQTDGQDECPEGKVRNDDGECVDAPEDDDGEQPAENRNYQATLTASVPIDPPRAWFENPRLDRATPLTVTEEGRVYGTLASWDECHLGIGNRCVTAPHSATDYALFKVGEVKCGDGAVIPTGKITLGTGHADPALGMVPASEHYDNTGNCVAVVNIGEDKFGIWVAGSLVPGVDAEKVAELRRSPLSGDWRRYNGNLELVAALAVNTPGFVVLRACADREEDLETLLAAGIVMDLETLLADGPTEPVTTQVKDRTSTWRRIENVVRSERVKSIFGGQ